MIEKVEESEDVRRLQCGILVLEMIARSNQTWHRRSIQRQEMIVGGKRDCWDVRDEVGS